MIVINDGLIKVPHLLMSTAENGKQVPWVSHTNHPLAIFILVTGKSRKTVCTVLRTALTELRISILLARLTKLRRNPVPRRSLAES